jgi:hypothetical protein
MLSLIKYFFYFFDCNIKKIIFHNRKLFINKNSNRNIVLFDFSENKQCHIPYSYTANILSSKYNARLTLFKTDIALSSFKNIIFHFLFFFSIFPFSIYKSFGVRNNVFYKFSMKDKRISLAMLKKIKKKINSKEDILNIKIDKIKIGDLIYDHYLKLYRLPTINLYDKKFLNFLYKSILIFNFWKNFFKENNVKAVSVTHAVYLTGIPTRIAIFRKIPVYHMNLTGLFKLDLKNDRPYIDFKYFKKTFFQLSSSKRKNLIKMAKRRINLRINKNKIGVDMNYSKKSAWIKKTNQNKVLTANNRIKILIAAHCFFDSPHGYGNMIFPDFYEWMDFLGKLSNKTEYDWYIKTHPDYLPENKHIINYFLNKYPKFNLLDPNTSHHQIINDGINYVLTCHGTVGFEYAIMNVPVINASLNNPHINYDFNIHVSNIENYKRILTNLKKIKINIRKNEIYQYYAMRFLNSKIDYIFEDTNKIFKKYDYKIESLPSDIYDDFIKYWSLSRHNKILNTVNNFFNSGHYQLQKKHFSDKNIYS